MANKVIRSIKTKTPQVCDICKKITKRVYVLDDKIVCPNCHSKISKGTSSNKVIDSDNNPKLYIAKKLGVHCNICNEVITTYQKFKSGKCICMSCFNKMTDEQVKKLQSEEYNANNTKKYENTLKIKFVQGGNP